MLQLRALMWLKWALFRNAMRSRKAVVSRVVGLLGTLAALLFSLTLAAALGVATYFITSPAAAAGGDAAPTDRAELAGFLFLLSVFAFLYLMWAILPLGIGGGGSRFDPNRLLLYPISLRKLFVIDMLSELTSLASIFAVPVVFAVSFAAGLARGELLRALLAGGWGLLFGIAFAKLLSTAVGALMRKRPTRGETVLALLGAAAGLAGAFLGQLAPTLARHAESLRGLRWTPPGALALALTDGLQRCGTAPYLHASAILAAYVVAFVAVTYLIARRAALGMNSGRGAADAAPPRTKEVVYVGWRVPLLPPALSAVVEKEIRYALRNAQLRVLAVMPLILIGVRFMQGQMESGGGGGGDDAVPRGGAGALAAVFTARYGEGVLAAAGVLYVFMILTAITCNLFAFENGGMRAFILSPLNRRTILVGKNIAVTIVAFALAALLIIVNQIVFRDLSFPALLFAALCFVLFAASFALIGNWLSIYFPKRLQFGKRLNATGVTGLLLIPMVIGMVLPPLAAVAVGYVAQSLLAKYATLLLFAVTAVALYGLFITSQGRALARRETDILDAVSGQFGN